MSIYLFVYLSDLCLLSHMLCSIVFNFVAGDIHVSAEMYTLCIEVHPSFHRARLNLATLHHQYGQIDIAIHQYEQLIGTVHKTISH